MDGFLTHMSKNNKNTAKNGLKKLDFCASLTSENNTAGPESPAVLFS